MDNTELNNATYRVRFSATESELLGLAEIDTINADLELKNLPLLKKITRSSGATEYVSVDALEHLEQNKRRRRNQRKLAEMQQPLPKPGLLARIIMRFKSK